MIGTEPGARVILAVVGREIEIRIINCSTTGCLFECSDSINVGTVASLRVMIDGRERNDDVRIVRCQPLQGAGASCHVGAEFLWIVPPHALSLREVSS